MSGFPLWLIFTEKNYYPVRGKKVHSLVTRTLGGSSYSSLVPSKVLCRASTPEKLQAAQSLHATTEPMPGQNSQTEEERSWMPVNFNSGK